MHLSVQAWLKQFAVIFPPIPGAVHLPSPDTAGQMTPVLHVEGSRSPQNFPEERLQGWSLKPLQQQLYWAQRSSMGNSVLPAGEKHFDLPAVVARQTEDSPASRHVLRQKR